MDVQPLHVCSSPLLFCFSFPKSNLNIRPPSRLTLMSPSKVFSSPFGFHSPSWPNCPCLPFFLLLVFWLSQGDDGQFKLHTIRSWWSQFSRSSSAFRLLLLLLLARTGQNTLRSQLHKNFGGTLHVVSVLLTRVTFPWTCIELKMK